MTPAPLFPCDVPRYVSKSAGMVEASPGQAGYVLYSDYARLSRVKDDLYAALRRMLESHDATCQGPLCALMGVDAARAALRKAEGRP